jgi:hypothetical protein
MRYYKTFDRYLDDDGFNFHITFCKDTSFSITLYDVESNDVGCISVPLLERKCLMNIKFIEDMADAADKRDSKVFQEILNDIEILKGYHFIGMVETDEGNGYATKLIKKAIEHTVLGLVIYGAETDPAVAHIIKKLGARQQGSFFVIHKD